MCNFIYSGHFLFHSAQFYFALEELVRPLKYFQKIVHKKPSKRFHKKLTVMFPTIQTDMKNPDFFPKSVVIAYIGNKIFINF